MRARYLLSAVAFAMVMAGTPALALDTSSLSAFVQNCAKESRPCHAFINDGVRGAKNSNYGCIPPELSVEDAGNQLLDWMKGPARDNDKYRTMSAEDVMWEGVDALWPCPKPQ